MTRLELSDEERGELRYVLETYLTDLRMEVSDTDRKDLRDRLKHRERLVKEWLARLGAPEWRDASPH